MPVRSSKIRVLIVEDSPVVSQNLKYILETDYGIDVIGMVEDGEDAVKFAVEERPDVITMDINLPGMNGLAATRKIMEINPVPIIIVSASFSRRDVAKTFLAMEAGAVAIAEKPFGLGHQAYETAARDLVRTVKLMSEVKVVRRWARTRTSAPAKKSKRGDVSATKIPANTTLIVIGASTGGPPVIQKILSGIKKGYPFPILVVQHIAKGFLGGLVEWLEKSVAISVHMATDGEPILPGHVYCAPDNFHMGIGKDGVITLSKSPQENGVRPSVSYLFRSALDTFGRNMVGMLLTGMGKDGVEELLAMKEAGALTVAQDRDSSVVYGMPGEAVKIGAATYVLSPEGIAGLLLEIAKKGRH